jgi:xanthine dehydrogenase large subunit
MLFATVFSSPIAHGRIKSLRAEEALAIDGIKAVITASDLPGQNQIGPIIQDEVLLAEDSVHFVGQPIAIVVANDPVTARRAASKIELDLTELPTITDPLDAYAKGEIIGVPRTFAMGDVENAWSHCHVIVEGRCDIGGQEHGYLETQRARAIPLEGNVVRIYSSTQSPYAVQRAAAKVLGVPHHLVEVEVKRLGGGFGGKEDQATPWSCMAALAARVTGSPVELVLSRAEDIKMTGKRHPYKSVFKLGATRDGVLLAYDVRHYQNSGATADLSTAVLERTLFHSTNSYFIPNVHAFAVCCRTNLPPNTAFRGFGGPQGMFVIESAIAKLAEELGIPREEIQARNLLTDGDSFPYGQRVQQGLSRATWDAAVTRFGFEKIKRQVDSFNESHFEIKKGLAMMPVCFGISFTSTFMNQASALVHVYTDGSVSVSTGGVEMGQGLSTNIVSVAARAFGIRPERIKSETTNTTRIANMSPSAASATTLLNGNATLLAVAQIVKRLKTYLADELQIEQHDLEIFEERILCKGKSTDWNWESLIRSAYLNRIGLSAHGFYATPNIHFDKAKETGKPFAYHVHGTAIIEVTLDCVDGTYNVDRVKIIHDLGRPLNEEVDLGQVEGGLAQGLGWMTMEDLVYDEKGHYLSGSLATYKMPDVYFMPDDIEVHFLENVEEETGPYGNKAVGEPPLMYGIGVFFALRHAMRAFRPNIVFDFKSPLTPERVLLQLYPEVASTLSRTQVEKATEVSPATRPQ